jgi:hypothetical protein
MKATTLRNVFGILLAASMLPACRVIGGIFKTGMGVGVVIAVIAVALVTGAFAMFRK